MAAKMHLPDAGRMRPAGMTAEQFPLGRPARLAVCVSGRGSNLQSLMNAFPPGSTAGEVVLVISDHAAAPALLRAEEAAVEAVHLPWARSGRAAFEEQAEEALAQYSVDLVVLAGFMRILSPVFVRHWRGRLLNIHPSLLPAFPGLAPQRRALAAGVRESGCTVHFVDEGTDTGPVVLSRRVPVFPFDTEQDLSERILVEEHQAYPDALRLVLEGWAFFDLVTEEVSRCYGPEAAALYRRLQGRTPEGASERLRHLRVAKLLAHLGVPERVTEAWRGDNAPVLRAAWLWEAMRLRTYRPAPERVETAWSRLPVEEIERFTTAFGPV